MPFDAIFFDLDDTLCNETESWKRCALQTAITASQVLPDLIPDNLVASFLESSDEYWRVMDPVQETRALREIRIELWDIALRHLGYSDRVLATQLAEAYGRNRATDVDLFPEALPLLAALNAAGKRLVIITNGLQETHIDRIAFLGLNHYFAHSVISDAVGFAKPNPRIFQHALDLVQCAPEHAAMVGDNYQKDIIGAHALGIATFWYNPMALPLPENTVAPNGDIRRLSELHDLLL